MNSFCKQSAKKLKKNKFVLEHKCLFFFIWCLFFLVPPACSMDKGDEKTEDIIGALFRMGFEIEFPSYGVSHEGAGSVEKSIILKGSKNLWGLYRDTLDSQVEKAYFADSSLGIWNLEFKTLENGIPLTHGENILQAATEISRVVKFLSGLTYATKQFGTHHYDASALPKSWKGGVTYTFPKEKILSLVKKGAKYNVVRPQITYQLPLSCLPYLFRHLYILGGKQDIKNFLSKPENIDRIKNLHKQLPRSVDGFILLFDYYVDRFVCNKHSTTEPGPKPSFSIMSRISFRDMYSHLPHQEQEEFRQHVHAKYQNFECKGYEYLALENKLRPLQQAIAQAEKDLNSYQKEIRALTQKNNEEANEETAVTINFYQDRERHLDVILNRDYSYLRTRETVLTQLQHKTFSDPIKVVYAIDQSGVEGILENAETLFSIEELLRSIVDPSFRQEIEIEADDQEDFIPFTKTTDLFSTPFSKLDQEYSMGVLPYPEHTDIPTLSIVEVRSYPAILGDISYEAIVDFTRVEKDYMEVIQHSFQAQAINTMDFKAAELANVRALSDITGIEAININGNKKITSLYID